MGRTTPFGPHVKKCVCVSDLEAGIGLFDNSHYIRDIYTVPGCSVMPGPSSVEEYEMPFPSLARTHTHYRVAAYIEPRFI